MWAPHTKKASVWTVHGSRFQNEIQCATWSPCITGDIFLHLDGSPGEFHTTCDVWRELFWWSQTMSDVIWKGCSKEVPGSLPWQSKSTHQAMSIRPLGVRFNPTNQNGAPWTHFEFHRTLIAADHQLTLTKLLPSTSQVDEFSQVSLKENCHMLCIKTHPELHPLVHTFGLCGFPS